MKKILSFSLIATLLLSAFTGCGQADGSEDAGPDITVIQAAYPPAAPYPNDSEHSHVLPADFYENAIPAFLGGAGDENRVCSPANIYIALAMLAEITDGGTRDQLLTALGEDNMDSLRASASGLWLTNYYDDSMLTCIPAASLWLDDSHTFRQETADILANNYYAASYRGKMGSEKFDKELQTWLDEQTGGLLKDQAAGMKFDRDSILALATTLYFKSRWGSEFSKNATSDEIFHKTGGDITCPFMHKNESNSYYRGENFSAVPLSFLMSGCMWLILPDEGTGVDELLADSASLLAMTSAPNQYENTTYIRVNLSVPKFDVTSQMDLREGLNSLGIRDVFDAGLADFTPIADDPDGIYLSQVSHAARVKIDEEGCEAAAFTVMELTGAAMPPEEEVDFVLDRPFLFIITGAGYEPLFAGVVNCP